MSTAPRFEYANYIERQPHFEPGLIRPRQDWFIQPAAKKPPRSKGEVKAAVWEPNQRKQAASTRVLEGLDDTYVIENRHAVTRFIEENRLHGLLFQAKQPLNATFGEGSIKVLSIASDDEGFETLFCLVLVSGDLQENRRALRHFDREWWLSRAPQAAGKLNFDFKLT